MNTCFVLDRLKTKEKKGEPDDKTLPLQYLYSLLLHPLMLSGPSPRNSVNREFDVCVPDV